MERNMIIAVAVAFILIFSAGAAFILMSDDTTNNRTVSIVGKVNSEGSGIFVVDSPELKDLTADIDAYNLDAQKALWHNLVFMTPGPGSIQHEMLRTFVEQTLEMNFLQNRTIKTEPHTVYWAQVAPGQMELSFKNLGYHGGITWEPWFSQIILGDNNAREVARSADLSPGHPCCMIVVDDDFLKNNKELVLRFMLAYVHAVGWVNEALAQGTGEMYESLINYAWITAYAGTGSVPAETRSIIESALKHTTFGYELDGLRGFIAEIAEAWEEAGRITQSINNYWAFADNLINYDIYHNIKFNIDALIENYMNTDGQPAAGTVRLGLLQNDLHQIAVNIANLSTFSGSPVEGKSLFEVYGVNVVTVDPQLNGNFVMNLFATGSIDIGVLGLPPTLLRSANGI
ncbi:MAG: ABC transporter substrate-binding protein [Methanomassiliicoccaceae archaeon]|nr:ABC transporter substrate-binding protein [Methanomassiliicoccaceae archaeon]